METNGRPRRRFFGKLSRVMVGIGGLIAAGVVPELRAATPGSTPVETNGPLPDAPELPLATVNMLYAQALSDADVALLISSLATTGRLDPPTKSHDVSLDAGNRAQAVTLPVRSYADGSTLAYICYGEGNSTASDGTTASLPIRGMVTATGGVYSAGGGRMAESPRPEYNEVVFAAMFPDQYFEARIVNENNGAALLLGRTGDCVIGCARDFQYCILIITPPAVLTFLLMRYCLTCQLLTGGSLDEQFLPTPLCRVPCMAADTAFDVARTVLRHCRAQCQNCIERCLKEFGPIPLPAPIEPLKPA